VCRACRANGEKRNVYRLLVGRPEGERPRCRWMDNINMDHVEIESVGVDWIGVKNGVFWDVTPCGSCKKRRFGGT
jgi:hypothetical protein